MPEFVRFTRRFLDYSIGRYRGIVGLTVALIVAGYVASAALAGALKWVTDAVIARDATSATYAALAVVFLGLTSRGNQLLIDYLWVKQYADGSHDLENHLLALDLTMPRVDHLEDPDYLDRYDLLRGDIENLVKILWTWVRILGAFAQTVLSTVLLLSVHPLVALFPLAVIPVLVADARGARIVDRARQTAAPHSRLAVSLHAIVTSPITAKEAKVARAETEIGREANDAWNRATSLMLRALLRREVLRTAAWLIFGAAQVLTAGWVGLRVVDGQAQLGDVVLVVTLGLQARGQLGTFVWNASRGMATGLAFRRYREVVKEHEVRTQPPADPVAAPDRLCEGLHLEDVRFRYPGSNDDALRGVTLHLPAGRTVAVVGENGAGKSTLVKLLCGLYEPSAGRITADGIDLARVPAEQWYARVAALFQDFARLQLTAGEYVGVGNLDRLSDTEALDTAIGRANAGLVLQHLPDGYTTQLGKQFPGGVELSGGEWQRLALAQTMMRQSPLVLVLDEPASALDPFAEHDLFENYAAAASESARKHGTITVLVSHRFSTVTMADQIIVLDAGTVSELGTHAELMQRRGLYAELFEMQSRAYAD